jgi:hypothetical protein
MIDRYTKMVLTVIAIALSALVVQNGINAARAQPTVTLGYNDACGTSTHPICQVHAQ